jgi:hypothetical protein
MTCILSVIVFVAFVAAAGIGAEAADVFAPSDADVGRVAAMLPPKPGGFCPPATDRAAWQRAAARSDMKALIARAEALLARPLPEMTDDLYLDYSRTGNRRRGEAVFFERRSRIPTLALAECLEGKGRFLAALEETLRAICAEKSWVMPAHDGSLETFNGRRITIDLGASMFAWDLAMADHLLAGRLSPEVHALVLRELERRIFAPYHLMCAGKQNQWWLLVKMNWNSVCLAGVTGAALAAIEDRRERAWFVLAAEHYSRNSLEGFTPDGYCDEGVGYWNYGFGHYAALAETVRVATRDGVDLMNRKEAVMPSAYGSRIEIVPGVCPAFADCDPDAKPSSGLVDYLSRRFTGKGTLRRRGTLCGSLCDEVMALFPQAAPVVRTAMPWPKTDPLRSWFPDPSVLLARPAAGSSCRLSVALQGGHNAQNHNHNDVGEFIVVVGKTPVLPDIGAEVYTQRTFSSRRYESRALNSWGHDVPVIAGKLQSAGRQAEARVLRTDFTDARDTVVLDIRAAYAVPTLARLERTYVYDRSGAGSLTITDDFAFTTPETFETALLTFGKWEQVDAGTLRVTDGGESVRVQIGLPAGAELEVHGEEVKENLSARRTATRIGLRLTSPLREGAVTLRITPER